MEDLVNHKGYKVILEELNQEYERSIDGLKGCKNWDEHIHWMSRIGLLEEMIPLRGILLEQEIESKKQKLEEKED